MASKKSTKRTTKKTKSHYPVVRSAELGSVAETAAVRILDTARALSVMNRRLYRYARVYPVKIDKDVGPGTVEVFALRDDWAVHQGMKMAYKQYLQNTADERERLGKQVARWEDFRVDDGVSAVNNPLLPKFQDDTFAGGGTLLSAGEFDLSVTVDQAGSQRTFTWATTPGATEWGVLHEYDKSGNAQNSPSSAVSGGPYEGMQENIDNATMNNLQGDGNQPPYNQTTSNQNFPWVKIATLGAGAGGDQRLSTGFFNAPCGLVVLVGNANDWNSSSVHFEVQKGDYKGVGGMSLLE